MATVNGGPVRYHVQKFADAVEAATGQRQFSTYPGHQPTQDRALDMMVRMDSQGKALGDRIAKFVQDNYRRFGIDYVIWYQRIWNPEVSPMWRPMADRGSPTQNHLDHPHVSFETTAPGPLDIGVGPTQEEDELFRPTDRGIFNPPRKDHIMSLKSHLLLGVQGHEPRNGALLEQYPADGAPDQRWFLWWHSNDQISLVCQASDGKLYAVDVPHNKPAAGLRLHVWPFNGANPAQWLRPEWRTSVRDNPDTDAVQFIVPGTDLVLDVEGGGRGPGVILWNRNDGLWQQWFLIPTI